MGICFVPAAVRLKESGRVQRAINANPEIQAGKLFRNHRSNPSLEGCLLAVEFDNDYHPS